RAPVDLGRPALARIGRFFALVPAGPIPALDALAADAVRFFDRFRAPPSEAEIARRRPDDLTERQRSYLRAWGYPFVFDAFRFHMTLTGPVPDERAGRMRAALAAHFEAAMEAPLPLDTVSLVVEADPPGPFRLHTRQPLAGAPKAEVA
ncbi:DUF1045 domain-containing protein, partial [Propylenella binzhouense]